MSSELYKKVEEILRREFTPKEFELHDDSDAHYGHSGNHHNGAHFRLVMKSTRFQDKSPVDRQRMVYSALGTLMDKEIHALSMKCIAD